MQSALTTGPSQDIVGVKRQKLPSIYDFAGHEEVLKKIRYDSQVKIEDSTSTQPSPKIHIPSFISARTPSLPSASPLLSPGASPNIKLDLLRTMMILNQSTLYQRYLDVLALNRYAQQHQKASLLIPSRDDSNTSCSSNTSHNSQIPIRVPILLRKPSEISSVSSTDIPKFEEAPLSSSKKSLKASACKNYIALLCTGFARSLLTAKTEGKIMSYMLEMIALKKGRFAGLEGKQDEELKDNVLEHIYRDICGKKVKKMNKGRDFKVRNSEELGELLTVKEEDSELVKFRKEILKDMLDYFFTSNYYFEWLENGQITQANKDFFLKNKSEIQKKFKNPMLYKPHFDY